MKKKYLLSTLLCAFILFGFSTTSYSQKASEKCVNGSCDEGLHCIDTYENGSKVRRCSECTQSELKPYTAKVNEKCKYFKEGESFKLVKNPKYLAAISKADSDTPRVPVGIYDEILEDVKQCRSARINRDDKCFDGGNPGHQKPIAALSVTESNIAKTKNEDYKYNKIFYCSKSSYSSAMSYYKSKCNSVNPSSIEDAMEKMESELNKGNKIDCDDLKEFINDCEDCRKKAYDLIRTAFDGNSNKTPHKIETKMDETEALVDMGEELLKKADSKDLCD